MHGLATSTLTWQGMAGVDKARLSSGLALGGHLVQRPQLASHVPGPRKDAPVQVPLLKASWTSNTGESHFITFLHDFQCSRTRNVWQHHYGILTFPTGRGIGHPSWTTSSLHGKLGNPENTHMHVPTSP